MATDDELTAARDLAIDACGRIAEFWGFTRTMGRAFGLCMMFVPVITLSPFLIARSQEATGSYTHAFIGGAVFLAFSGLLATLYHERRSAPPAFVEPQSEAPVSPL